MIAEKQSDIEQFICKYIQKTKKIKIKSLTKDLLWPSKYERHTHIYVYMYMCFVNAGNILFYGTKMTTVKRQCCGVIAKTVGKDIKS